MDKHPPIFLINLDDSTDRLKTAYKRLAPYNFNITRVSAVVGKYVDKETLNKYYCARKNREGYYRELGPGEIGCFLSHLKVMQNIVDNKIPYAIILEDDFKVVGELDKAISALENIDFAWDMVKLAEYGNKVRPTAHQFKLNNEFDLKIQKKVSAGTCAQAVSLAGAKKILEGCIPFGRPVDTDYQYWWEKNLEVLTLSPTPLKQDLEFESTISKMAIGLSFEKAFFRRKLQQLKQSRLNIKHTKLLVNKFKQLKKT